MRVLQIVGSLGRGGAETMITNYQKAANLYDCYFDYIIHDTKKDGYESVVKKLGSRIIIIKKPRNIGFFNYIKQLVNVIKEYGPFDAVHSHTDYQAFMVVIASKIAHVPVCVVHSHTTKYTFLQKIVNRIIFFVCNPVRLSCGREAGNMLFGNNNFFILNNAIPVKDYCNLNYSNINSLVKEFSIPNGYKIIGQVGRLVKLKNHKFTLEVLCELKKTGNYLLFIVGSGEDELELEELCKKYSLEENVKFLGSRSDMCDIYHLFDVLVMPSFFEGLPMTLLEAQSSGIPCICSDNISRESDRKLDLVSFLPLDVKLWVNQIKKTNKQKISSDEIYKAMNDYDIINQCENLIQIYKKGR